MDTETTSALNEVLTSVIKKNLDDKTCEWVFHKAAQATDKNNNYQLNITFTSIPPHTGKAEINLEENDKKKLQALLPGFSISGWTIDRLCRVWLMMQLESDNKKAYISRIENLFRQPEMNELVALYSSLPVLAYSEEWKLRCAEGIRSNIGIVLDALMYHNPYPAEYLDEIAWNQLVLKAFFTDKDVNKIAGLDERSNQHLASILFDYVEERRAAGRTVNPQIWRLTANYIDETHFYLFEELMHEGNETEKKAGALALNNSSFPKAAVLLDQYPGLKADIEQKKFSWQNL
ncbi:MAG: EboA domain-containing protein [Ginsengibacter sp.]